MGQYSLFENPNDRVNTDLDASMKPWTMGSGLSGDCQFRAANPVLLGEGESLAASIIYKRSIKLPGYIAADYDMGKREKILNAFRVSVIAKANQTSYVKCEYMESTEYETDKNVVAYFKELPMHLLENQILVSVYEFGRSFWEKHKPVVKTFPETHHVIPKIRHAKIEEQLLFDRLTTVEDLAGNNTGWKKIDIRNDGNQLLCITLVSQDAKYSVDIINKRPSSGTEQYRTGAIALAYAIDHPYVAVTPEHEHAGFNINPLWMQSGELKYAVQTIDNFRKSQNEISTANNIVKSGGIGR